VPSAIITKKGRIASTPANITYAGGTSSQAQGKEEKQRDEKNTKIFFHFSHIITSSPSPMVNSTFVARTEESLALCVPHFIFR